MRFTLSEELRDYMVKKHKTHIVVEVAESNASDFEVTEIYYRLCNDKHAAYLIDKKGYRKNPLVAVDESGRDIPSEPSVEEINVLLKPYRFEMGEEVHFHRKKSFFISHISASGISL